VEPSKRRRTVGRIRFAGVRSLAGQCTGNSSLRQVFVLDPVSEGWSDGLPSRELCTGKAPLRPVLPGCLWSACRAGVRRGFRTAVSEVAVRPALVLRPMSGDWAVGPQAGTFCTGNSPLRQVPETPRGAAGTFQGRRLRVGGCWAEARGAKRLGGVRGRAALSDSAIEVATGDVPTGRKSGGGDDGWQGGRGDDPSCVGTHRPWLCKIWLHS